MVLKSHEMCEVYKQNVAFLQSLQNKIDITQCIFDCDFNGLSAINRGVWIEFFVTNGGLRNCFPLHDSHIGDPFHSIKTTLCQGDRFFLGTMAPTAEGEAIVAEKILLPKPRFGKTLLKLQADGSFNYNIANHEHLTFSPFKVIH